MAKIEHVTLLAINTGTPAFYHYRYSFCIDGGPGWYS